jgi:tetratricopeptide (TPR) repeat protein
VVHEAVYSPTYKTSGLLSGLYVHVTSEGASWSDPKKYHKHAEMLEKEVARQPSDTRSRFYLANSYRDSVQWEKAIEQYEIRIAMGGWDEEVFNSMLNIAKLQEQLHYSSQVFLTSYLRAFQYRPTRIEPLYYIGRWYNSVQNYVTAFSILKQVIRAPATQDSLFVDHWIYEEGRWMDYSQAERGKGGFAPF